MKTINLELDMTGLKMPEGDTRSPRQVVKDFIEGTLLLYQQQRNGVNITDQRKIVKILDQLEKTGNLELEDDYFDFLYGAFETVKWTGGTKLAVIIADELDRVKLEGIKKA